MDIQTACVEALNLFQLVQIVLAVYYINKKPVAIQPEQKIMCDATRFFRLRLRQSNPGDKEYLISAMFAVIALFPFRTGDEKTIIYRYDKLFWY